MIERDGLYYVVNGHHRIAMLKVLEHLKIDDIVKIVNAKVRRITKDINFTTEFVKLCKEEKLYNVEYDDFEGYGYYIPHFTTLGANNDKHLIRHDESGFVIDDMDSLI